MYLLILLVYSASDLAQQLEVITLNVPDHLLDEDVPFLRPKLRHVNDSFRLVVFAVEQRRSQPLKGGQPLDLGPPKNIFFTELFFFFFFFIGIIVIILAIIASETRTQAPERRSQTLSDPGELDPQRLHVASAYHLCHVLLNIQT